MRQNIGQQIPSGILHALATPEIENGIPDRAILFCARQSSAPNALLRSLGTQQTQAFADKSAPLFSRASPRTRLPLSPIRPSIRELQLN